MSLSHTFGKLSSKSGPVERVGRVERMIQNKYTLNQKADHPYIIMLRSDRYKQFIQLRWVVGSLVSNIIQLRGDG